jgi:hypothetical protein
MRSSLQYTDYKWWRIAKSVARFKNRNSVPPQIKSQYGRILHPNDKVN